MGHRYSRHPDHIRRRTMPVPENAAVDEHLQSLLSPGVYSQQGYYQTLGLRERILTLPLMVAAVVTLLWRQVPSVGELTRMLNRDDLLWAKAVKVSRQSVSERFLSFPYRLFEGVFRDLMPTLTARWAQRPYGLAFWKSGLWGSDSVPIHAKLREFLSILLLLSLEKNRLRFAMSP